MEGRRKKQQWADREECSKSAGSEGCSSYQPSGAATASWTQNKQISLRVNDSYSLQAAEITEKSREIYQVWGARSSLGSPNKPALTITVSFNLMPFPRVQRACENMQSFLSSVSVHKDRLFCVFQVQQVESGAESVTPERFSSWVKRT